MSRNEAVPLFLYFKKIDSSQTAVSIARIEQYLMSSTPLADSSRITHALAENYSTPLLRSRYMQLHGRDLCCKNDWRKSRAAAVAASRV